MARRVGIWLAIAALYYVCIAAGLYAFQRELLYFPDSARPQISAAGVHGLREVDLATSDGLRLLAWYLPPPEGRPVLVHFHGNGGSIRHRAFQLQLFAQAGMGVLMPEYRGYGGNEGEPSEAGLFADGAAAMEFLRAQGFGPDRIIVYGESLGTGVAVRLASEPAVAALVLESPYTSIAAVAADTFFFLPVNLLVKDRFDSLSRIGKVRSPILIMQAQQDEMIPPALGRELFDAAPEPKEFWSARQGGHNDLYRFGAGAAAISFLRRHVPSLQ